MLNWLKQFNIFCLLDNQSYPDATNSYEYLVAAGVRKSISGADLLQLDVFLDREPSWVFGHLSYRLKDHLFPSTQVLNDPAGFPPYFFFSALVVIAVEGDRATVWAEDPAAIWKEVLDATEAVDVFGGNTTLRNRLGRASYVNAVRMLQQHILRGDCYEVNFCQEQYAEHVTLNPFQVFRSLAQVSPNPFSAFYRLDDKYLLCASPERFLKKDGNRLLSQPIKGTIKRNREDEAADGELKRCLHASTKDRSENVMVVDLVRNDLSKLCTEGSVKVDELFGVYTYPQVHQMISTVSGLLRPGLRFSDILKASFPMGSMTGAPKQKVMELIDRYELPVRGIFSGAVGYFTPMRDFDFNVVIRSIIYNQTTQYLSCPSGSGITFYSDPEKEWEECLLKAEAMSKVLQRGLSEQPGRQQ